MKHQIIIEQSDLINMNIATAKSLLSEAYYDSDMDTKLKKTYLAYLKIADSLKNAGVIE